MSDEDVEKIRKDVRKVPEIATAFLISKSHVYQIRSGLRRNDGTAKTVIAPRKITDEMARAIFLDTRHESVVAGAFEVSESSVDQIRRRKLRRSATENLQRVHRGSMLEKAQIEAIRNAAGNRALRVLADEYDISLKYAQAINAWERSPNTRPSKAQDRHMKFSEAA